MLTVFAPIRTLAPEPSEDGPRPKGGQVDPMFDSLTIARQLTDAGIERAQADGLADAIRRAD